MSGARALVAVAVLLMAGHQNRPAVAAQPGAVEPTAPVPAANGPGTIAPVPQMVEHPLGMILLDDSRMDVYSYGSYLLYVVNSLWSVGILGLIVFSGFAATL